MLTDTKSCVCMLIVYTCIDVYASTPLNKWNREECWKGMEQDDLLLDHLPEFTPPVGNNKKSQKSVASRSPDDGDIQLVAFPVGTSSRCLSRGNTNGNYCSI